MRILSRKSCPFLALSPSLFRSNSRGSLPASERAFYRSFTRVSLSHSDVRRTSRWPAAAAAAASGCLGARAADLAMQCRPVIFLSPSFSLAPHVISRNLPASPVLSCHTGAAKSAISVSESESRREKGRDSRGRGESASVSLCFPSIR